jgi:hypothetical protein
MLQAKPQPSGMAAYCGDRMQYRLGCLVRTSASKGGLSRIPLRGRRSESGIACPPQLDSNGVISVGPAYSAPGLGEHEKRRDWPQNCLKVLFYGHRFRNDAQIQCRSTTLRCRLTSRSSPEFGRWASGSLLPEGTWDAFGRPRPAGRRTESPHKIECTVGLRAPLRDFYILTASLRHTKAVDDSVFPMAKQNPPIRKLLAAIPLAFAAQQPHFVSQSPLVRRLAARWAGYRCSHCPAPIYDCPARGTGDCRHPTPSRSYCTYLFGPVGWSSSPSEHTHSSLHFIGARRDCLPLGMFDTRHFIIAHEMTHERQTSCCQNVRAPMSLRRVFQLEMEAERESVDHVTHLTGRFSARFRFARAASTLRAGVAAYLWRVGTLGLILTAMGLVSLIGTMWLFLPPRITENNITVLSLHVLQYVVMVIFIRRIILALWLAWNAWKAGA